jgi:hypothetical protein
VKDVEATPDGRQKEALPRVGAEIAMRPVGGGAEMLQLQRTVGNRAAQQVLQRGVGDWFKKKFGYAYIASLGGERVAVANETEEAEAKRIIKECKDNYGVSFSTMQGVKSTLATYKDAPEAERKKVKAKPWLMTEIRALGRALAHFAPILGKARAKSTRKDADQEITTVGKVTYSIDDDSATGKIDSTLGQYYSGDKNFAMYGKGETSDIDFPGNVPKQQEATAVHEIAHGLLEYALPGFIAACPYWLDRRTKSNVAGVEAPPTDYGAKNAAEDMCESVMFYFVDKDRLKNGNGPAKGTPGNACPDRLAYLEAVIGGWTPAPLPATIEGDGLGAPVTDGATVVV